MTTYDPEAPQRERKALFQGLFVTFVVQSMITATVGLVANATGADSIEEALLLTSFLGSCLLAYGTLALLHFYESLDAVTWSDDNAMLLNTGCGIATLFGFLFQFYYDRRRTRRLLESGEEGDDDV